MSTPVLEWDEEFEILLDQLRPQHREALLLHYKEGLPYGEAAQELHCPVTTIKVWCHRGVRKLRALRQQAEESLV
jgi:RNA polymerase sigma factor (sigma-70 family)